MLVPVQIILFLVLQIVILVVFKRIEARTNDFIWTGDYHQIFYGVFLSFFVLLFLSGAILKIAIIELIIAYSSFSLFYYNRFEKKIIFLPQRLYFTLGTFYPDDPKWAFKIAHVDYPVLVFNSWPKDKKVSRYLENDNVEFSLTPLSELTFGEAVYLRFKGLMQLMLIPMRKVFFAGNWYVEFEAVNEKKLELLYLRIIRDGLKEYAYFAKLNEIDIY